MDTSACAAQMRLQQRYQMAGRRTADKLVTKIICESPSCVFETVRDTLR